MGIKIVIFPGETSIKRLGDGDDSRSNIPQEASLAIGPYLLFICFACVEFMMYRSTQIVFPNFSCQFFSNSELYLSDKDLIKNPEYVPLRIVTRNEWLAQPPEGDVNDLDLPVSRVIITHSETENCVSQVSG